MRRNKLVVVMLLSLLVLSFLSVGLPTTMAQSVLGYNVIGGSSDVSDGTTATAWKFTSDNGGDATKITIYTKSNTGTINMKAGFWADDAGEPDALLASSAAVSVSNTAGWVEFTISYTFVSGTYWFGVIADNGYYYYYDAGSGSQQWANYGGVTYPTVPNPFAPTSWAHGDNKGSIYVTYTPAGPTPTPSPSPTPPPLSNEDLYVTDNKINYPNGTVFLVRGCTYTFLAFDTSGCWMGADGLIHWNTWVPGDVIETLGFMQAAGCNALRLFLDVGYWLDDVGSYRSHVEYLITSAGQRGIYVDLTFWNINSTEFEIGVFPWKEPANGYIYSIADFVNLWGNVSTVLKDYHTILGFELWNEPNSADGSAADRNEWFNVTQLCIDRIRSVGAGQPIIIQYTTGIAYNFENGGDNWLNNLNYWNMGYVWANPVYDSANKLIFSTHVYRYSFENGDVEDWRTSSGHQEMYNSTLLDYALTVTGVWNVAQYKPVIVNEMGCNNFAWDYGNETSYWNSILTLFDQHNVGYMAFALPPPTQNMQQYSLLDTGDDLNGNTWTGLGVVNYTLALPGEIFIAHTGGSTYAEWLEGEPATPTPTAVVAVSATSQILALVFWVFVSILNVFFITKPAKWVNLVLMLFTIIFGLALLFGGGLVFLPWSAGLLLVLGIACGLRVVVRF